MSPVNVESLPLHNPNRTLHPFVQLTNIDFSPIPSVVSNKMAAEFTVINIIGALAHHLILE
jgi:hypothetical protein